MLASLLPLGFFLAMQNILHERCMAGRRTMPAAKRIQKRVPVFEEEGRQYICRLSDRYPCGVVCVAAAGTVIEQHGGKRTVAGGFPEICLQSEFPAGKLNHLRSHR